jgi:predicted PurR-regulated permease PerM
MRPSAPVSLDEPFLRRTLTVLALVTLIVFASLVVCLGKNIFFLIFAGVLFATFLRGLADFVRRWTHLPHGWALTLVVIVLLGLLCLCGWFLSSTIGNQVDELVRHLRTAWSQLRSYLESQTSWGRDLFSSSFFNNWLSNQDAVIAGLSNVFGDAAEAFGYFLVVLVVGVYVAINPGLYRRGVLHLVPLRSRARADVILVAMDDALRGWLLGRFVNMILIGGITTLGLWLLGLPLVIPLGLMVFALDFVPYFGPLFAAIPAILVGLSSDKGPLMGVWVAVLYFGIQLVETHITLPLIQKRAVEMPPAILISAEALMGVLVGPLGLIFATPLASVSLVFIKMAYVESALGDDTAMPRAERQQHEGNGRPGPASAPAGATKADGPEGAR